MPENERLDVDPTREIITEHIQRALVRAAELHHSAMVLTTPNAELIQKACVAQIAMLEQDLRTHTKTTNNAGPSYSAEDEAIAVLQDIIRHLRRRHNTEISNSIAYLDPDQE